MTTELAVFDEVVVTIAEFKKWNAKLEFNYEDPQGNKDARSHIYKLRQAKTKITDIHKIAKAEALGVCRILDGKKKQLIGDVDEMIDVHYKPVKEIEERVVKAAAVKANDERLERIRVEAERVAEMEKREDELAEREAVAKAKEDALIRGQEKLEAAKQAEIDKAAAVKEAQEQASRERQLVTEAAEQDKKDAAVQAEREKQAAVEAEQEKARQETQRIKDEATKIAADLVAEEARIKAGTLAKQEREAKIEAKRVADKKHREKIEDEIRDAVDEIIRVASESGTGGSEEITSALINNEIPNITINY